MNYPTRLSLPAMLVAAASMLVACGPSPLADAPKTIRDVVGSDLPGAQGLTVLDQDRIDSAMAGLCATGTYDAKICAAHGRASEGRRRFGFEGPPQSQE